MALSRLTFWRLMRGIRQRDLADQIGINDTLLSHFEAGRRSIPDDVLMRLSAALNVPPVALVGVITDEDAKRLTSDPGH